MHTSSIRCIPLLVATLLSAIAFPAHAQDIIQVMSFNLRYASAPEDQHSRKQWDSPAYSSQRRQLVSQVISNQNPDIIGFQEGEAAQLDYLEAQFPAYAFQRQHPSGGGGAEHAAFAYKTNRIELLDRDVFSLGPAPGGGYWNNNPTNTFLPRTLFPGMNYAFPRLALRGHMRWKPTGQEFLFYTTHFDTYNSANQGETQLKSAHLIVDDARSRVDRMPSSPLSIVVGDFNGSQNDRAWKLFAGQFTTNGITGDYTDSWYQVHNTWTDSGTMHDYNGGTQPASARIDWILHRGGFTATQCVIITNSVLATNLSTYTVGIQYPSDHYPIHASLRLPPPALDTDRDGLPDTLEFSRVGSLPADPDSDGDGLLDGQEDLNGNGVVDGGETDALSPGDTQLPTDIRTHAMNGVRDFKAVRIAQHGLDLYTRFDGRYLYVATQDAGEGNDHFIFVTTNPTAAVAAPWAKSGQVAPWLAYLADENDSDFCGWFDASGSLITNRFLARASTYFQNGGRLEGVIDLAALLGAGFTTSVYLASAPYGNADGGALITSAQAPEGNGDAHLTGIGEFALLEPGDADGDGINDFADPDADGDGLNDAWGAAHGLAVGSGAEDEDLDGVSNRDEYHSCTDPTKASSVFRFLHQTSTGLVWSVVHGKRYALEISSNQGASWSGITTSASATHFPTEQMHIPYTPAATSHWVRLRLVP